MLRILYLIVIVAFFFSNAWALEDWSEKPIIDQEFSEYEKDIDRVTDDCMKKEKSVIKKMKCGDDIRLKYIKEGNLRGTDEYCKKHYGNLSFDELRNVWKKLKHQRTIARITPDEKLPGEVTEGMFMVEEFWVESRLAHLQKERTAVIEKAVFNKAE
jgi:hypothetical protein